MGEGEDLPQQRTAASYTGAPAPTLSANLPAFLDVASFDALDNRVLTPPAIGWDL